MWWEVVTWILPFFYHHDCLHSVTLPSRDQREVCLLSSGKDSRCILLEWHTWHFRSSLGLLNLLQLNLGTLVGLWGQTNKWKRDLARFTGSCCFWTESHCYLRKNKPSLSQDPVFSSVWQNCLSSFLCHLLPLDELWSESSPSLRTFPCPQTVTCSSAVLGFCLTGPISSVQLGQSGLAFAHHFLCPQTHPLLSVLGKSVHNDHICILKKGRLRERAALSCRLWLLTVQCPLLLVLQSNMKREWGEGSMGSQGQRASSWAAEGRWRGVARSSYRDESREVYATLKSSQDRLLGLKHLTLLSGWLLSVPEDNPVYFMPTPL